MENIITISNQGTCEKFNIDDFILDNNKEIYRKNFEHLLIYDFNDKYKLVIDTFNDKLELVKNNIAEYFVADKNLKQDDIKTLNYYANIFISPNTEFGRKIMNKKYNQYIQNNKNHIYYFVICPTYSCNMKCIYCYQQHNDDLNKKIISDKNLEKIFEYINNEVDLIRKNDINSKIVIELFGGEPIQKCNKDIIKKIFEFARENKFYIAATTNGTELEEFYDLFITYHKYICTIATTIDGIESYHNSRRISKKYKNNFLKILRNIEFLLDIGIIVELYINLDKDNINQLQEVIELIKNKKWNEDKRFHLKIGRVDDRLYETNYNSIIKESELLEHIHNLSKQIDIPNNMSLAFLKTCLYLTERFNISFNQNEKGRQNFHYCWSTSKIQHTVYIDSELNIFRCTYTVGKENLAIGKLNDDKYKNNFFNKHNSLIIDKCRKCKLGGYCGGGCILSYKVNPERQCIEEKENFDYFVNNLIVPIIKENLNDE